MNRRELIMLLGGAAAGWPLAARGQTNPMKRLAVLMGISEEDPESKARLTALGEGLEGVGWKEGQNVHIEYRYAAGDLNRIRSYAAEIVRMSPDVILVNSAPALAALREETRTIPIVFAQVADPVVAGLVASLAYPGGNITGFTQFEPSVGEKWLETLKEIAPGMTRAAVMGNSQNPNWSASVAAIRRVAPSLSVGLTPVDVTDVSGIEAAIKSFASEANGGLVVLTDINNTVNRDIIIAMAVRYRLPAIYPYRFWVKSGGLISYGIDNLDLYRRAASYVDRIFKGSNPADLPVQTPNKFQLVINLKTAKALGLEVPPTLLARADEVIE
jgi:putative tryptophan/tyrosine transport system substrate-binding protein